MSMTRILCWPIASYPVDRFMSRPLGLSRRGAGSGCRRVSRIGKTPWITAPRKSRPTPFGFHRCDWGLCVSRVERALSMESAVHNVLRVSSSQGDCNESQLPSAIPKPDKFMASHSTRDRGTQHSGNPATLNKRRSVALYGRWFCHFTGPLKDRELMGYTGDYSIDCYWLRNSVHAALGEG